MNLGSIGGGQCLGGIFDLGLGSQIGSGGGNPSWVVGDTFLVRAARLQFFVVKLTLV
jgi:cathepsin D